MILLIDNYDSFSYNLYQLVGSIDPNIRVERNDALEIEDIRQLKPGHIILSPGPGRPEDAGICEAVVRELAGKIPILGVCLGHQAICEALGGNADCHILFFRENQDFFCRSFTHPSSLYPLKIISSYHIYHKHIGNLFFLHLLTDALSSLFQFLMGHSVIPALPSGYFHLCYIHLHASFLNPI